jgi:hypothetical protein
MNILLHSAQDIDMTGISLLENSMKQAKYSTAVVSTVIILLKPD